MRCHAALAHIAAGTWRQHSDAYTVEEFARRIADTSDDVMLTVSPQAAHFLLGFMKHVNDVKMLPPDPVAALETSAWMEEIAAKVEHALGIGKAAR